VNATREERAPDEHPHRGAEIEWWAIELVASDPTRGLDLGGYVQITTFAGSPAWCWIGLAVPAGPVLVRDQDVPRPRGDALLARGDALWCELVCETPMEHWAVNVEAFGVLLDDPFDAWSGEVGHRVPVGAELDWEVATARVERGRRDGAAGCGGYEHGGTVRGELIVGADTITIDGVGRRVHEWGLPAWWDDAAGHDEWSRFDDGTWSWRDSAFDDVRVDVAGAVPLVVERVGDPTRRVDRALVRATRGDGVAGVGWRRTVVPDRIGEPSVEPEGGEAGR